VLHGAIKIMVEPMAVIISGQSKVNSNGQITVPVEIRDKLDLEKGESKMKWLYVNGEIRVYELDEV